MRRRTYLATATAVALGGCMGGDDSGAEPETNSTTSTDDSSGGNGESSTDTNDSSNEPEDEGTDENEEEEQEQEEEEEEEEEETQDLVGTFDDFEDLSNWTVLEGTVKLDEKKAYVGDQSARMEAGLMENRVNMSYEFDEPTDLTDVVPGLAVASEELVVPMIQVFDESGDHVHYRRAIKGDLPMMRYNFGIEEIVGDPDLSAVTEIRVLLWTDDYQSRQFWVDDFHFLPRPETGKVMIQFDDTHDTDYTEGLPVLEEYGYPAATFINPNRVGRSEEDLTLEQLEELADAGWTIGSHSLSHPDLTQLSADEQEREIADSKRWLDDHGFDGKYFAYPFGEYDNTTLELVEEYHELGFAGGHPVQGYAANPLVCTRIGDPSAERAIEMLDQTAEMRGITSMFYHRLEGQRLEDFRQTIEHLHKLESAGEIELILPEDLEDELQF